MKEAVWVMIDWMHFSTIHRSYSIEGAEKPISGANPACQESIAYLERFCNWNFWPFGPICLYALHSCISPLTKLYMCYSHCWGSNCWIAKPLAFSHALWSVFVRSRCGIWIKLGRSCGATTIPPISWSCTPRRSALKNGMKNGKIFLYWNWEIFTILLNKLWHFYFT